MDENGFEFVPLFDVKDTLSNQSDGFYTFSMKIHRFRLSFQPKYIRSLFFYFILSHSKLRASKFDGNFSFYCCERIKLESVQKWSARYTVCQRERV